MDLKNLSDQDLDQLINQQATVISGGDAAAGGGQPWTPMLVGSLTAGILVFGLIVMLLIMKTLTDQTQNHEAGDVLRLFTVPLVIVAALVLVILGFSNQQMTPVIGLLGTLIGYILGTGRQRPSVSQKKKKTSPTRSPS